MTTLISDIPEALTAQALALARPVAADRPCGASLLGTNEQQVLSANVESAMGRFRQDDEGDAWAVVCDGAQALLEQSKDLEFAVAWALAQVKLGGVAGLKAGISLFKALINDYWDDLYPRRMEGDSMGAQRRNWLNEIVAPKSLLRIREIQLFVDENDRPVTIRDFLLADGIVKTREGEAKPDGKALASQLERFCRSDEQAASTLAQEILAVLELVDALSQDLAKLTGATNFLRWEELVRYLASVKRSFSAAIAPARGVVRSQPAGNGARTGDRAQFEPGEPASEASDKESNTELGRIVVNSHETARAALRLVIEYFENNEKSSPVPLLLKRAERLIGKDFMECVQDMAASGVADVKKNVGMSKATGSASAPD